ncbi:hypothetical protein C8E88_101184, partial [Fibrobacter sp. UWR1]
NNINQMVNEPCRECTYGLLQAYVDCLKD